MNNNHPYSSYLKIRFGAVLAISIGIVFYLVLERNGLKDTAALYVGLPILLALILALTEKSGTTAMSCVKATTIFLLLSIPVLQEGFICVAMAAPILISLAALMGYLFEKAKDAYQQRATLRTSAPIILLGLLALEGTHEALTFDRFNEVQASRITVATAEQIESWLERTPNFTHPAPMVTRIFPGPVAVQGRGLNIGAKRSIDLVYNKHVFFNAHSGSTEFEVVEHGPTHVRFRLTKDTSYIANYLRWRYSEVSWQTLDNGKTRVIWRLGYERKLDPIWYFGPLQSIYTRLCAGYLLDNLIAPTGA